MNARSARPTGQTKMKPSTMTVIQAAFPLSSSQASALASHPSGPRPAVCVEEVAVLIEDVPVGFGCVDVNAFHITKIGIAARFRKGVCEKFLHYVGGNPAARHATIWKAWKNAICTASVSHRYRVGGVGGWGNATRLQPVKAASCAPEMRRRREGAMGKTWRGVPAAAQTVSKASNVGSKKARGGVRWPTGATPPMAKPVWARISAASALPRRSPASVEALSAST